MDHRVVMAVVPVMAVVTVVARDAEAGEENRRDDEQDPGDDHNPRSKPVEPIRLSRGSWRWCDRGRCGGGFRKFTHA
jgi:hypothetical protein